MTRVTVAAEGAFVDDVTDGLVVDCSVRPPVHPAGRAVTAAAASIEDSARRHIGSIMLRVGQASRLSDRSCARSVTESSGDRQR